MTELEQVENELAYTNGVANQFAGEAETWRRYAMDLLDAAKSCAIEARPRPMYGPGSMERTWYNCRLCGAAWMKTEPDQHAPGCILDPALYSDELATLMKTPLPEL